MTSYVKIYGNQLLRSTVWVNTNKETKLVWITLLAIADKHGMALASIPGLAKEAGVSIEECEGALDVLRSPDAYSRTKKYEGRRLEDIDGGFLLLNYKKYRELRTEAQVNEAERKAAWRARQSTQEPNGHVPGQTDVPSSPVVSRTTPTPTPSPTPKEDSTTTTTAREELRQQLTDEGRDALDGLTKGSAQPEALLGECRMILAGERNIKPTPTPAGVSLALTDLLTNGTRPTARSLRTYTADAMRQLTEGISTQRGGGENLDAAFERAIKDAKEREGAE